MFRDELKKKAAALDTDCRLFLRSEDCKVDMLDNAAWKAAGCEHDAGADVNGVDVSDGQREDEGLARAIFRSSI